MTLLLPPFLFFYAAIACLLLGNERLRSIILIVVPLISLVWIASYDIGAHASLNVAGLTLEFMRVDRLARIFGIIFSIAAFLSALYAWHVKDVMQQVATLGYAGAAIGGVFAGDLLTLFLYWEGTAVTSVFLIWARRTEGAYHTGMRYLIIQVLSGVLLLMGCLLYTSPSPRDKRQSRMPSSA